MVAVNGMVRPLVIGQSFQPSPVVAVSSTTQCDQERPVVVTTSAGYPVDQTAFTGLLKNVFIRDKKRRQRPDVLATPDIKIPLARPIDVKPNEVKRACAEVSRFRSVLAGHVPRDLLRYTEVLSGLSALMDIFPDQEPSDFFTALSATLFSHQQYHGIIDVVFACAKRGCSQSMLDPMAEAKYSGIDVSHARPTDEMKMASTALEHVFNLILHYVNYGKKIESSLNPLLYARCDIFTDFDKKELLCRLETWKDKTPQMTGAQKRRLGPIMTFLRDDLLSRSELYKDCLFGQIQSQRALERLLGIILFEVDMAEAMSSDRERMTVGLDVVGLLTESRLTLPYHGLLLHELDRRLRRGLGGVALPDDVIAGRMKLIEAFVPE
ncbi:MAG TPA: hypothetical protein VJC18_03240 [bacterium]|nr:hypothetical protein [bacterium]